MQKDFTIVVLWEEVIDDLLCLKHVWPSLENDKFLILVYQKYNWINIKNSLITFLSRCLVVTVNNKVKWLPMFPAICKLMCWADAKIRCWNTTSTHDFDLFMYVFLFMFWQVLLCAHYQLISRFFIPMDKNYKDKWSLSVVWMFPCHRNDQIWIIFSDEFEKSKQEKKI